MAAVTFADTTTSALNAGTYTSDSFVPAAGDLLVVLVYARGTVAAGSLNDSQSLGFSRIDTAVKSTSADTVYLFIADALAAATSMFVNFFCTGDNATSVHFQILRVSGMARVSASAVRQIAKQNNQSASTPAPVLGVAALTTNPLIGIVANNSNPPTMTEPSGWTEQADTGSSSTGSHIVSRDSGFTGTTVTWGSASATVFCSMVVELDASVPGGVGTSLWWNRYGQGAGL